MPLSRFGGLWRHTDFLKLWTGQTISQLGTQITLLALPLAAVLLLGASPLEMGLLAAAERAPFLLVGLPAGVWVDRRARRPILLAGDFGRALVLATIPAAYLLGALTMIQLYLVGFTVGVLTVFFDVAYMSYLPSLVEREQLVEGNSKLEVSSATAQVAGPGIAGAVIGLLSAPIAILLDAVSFLTSGTFICWIRKPEPSIRGGSASGATMRAEIGEGLRYVLSHPLLRPIAAATGTVNLFVSAAMALYILFATTELGLEAATLGTVFAIGNVGSLIGALLPGRVAARLGLGPTIVGSAFLFSLGGLLVPLATHATAVPLLIAGWFIGGVANPIYNVNQVSLRQSITPGRLQGRMNATMRFLVWGTMPLGSLLGGVLGEWLGLRPALLLLYLGALGAGLWVLLSPVRNLREQPVLAEP